MGVAGPFAALHHRFDLAADDPVVTARVERLFAGLRTTGPAAHHYDVAGGELRLDGSVLRSGLRPGEVVTHLMWAINQRAIDETTDLLLFHAGGVASGGGAVLLPAPMESGKTTLTAALVARGLDYVTDETVAVDPAGLEVVPYHKPLSIDRGSWAVLPDLRPADAGDSEQWHVPAEDIRPCSLAGATRPVLIVAPRYDAGVPTRLERVRGSEAVVLLAENSFNFRDDGRRWLPVLGAMAARCPCYRLAVSDLEQACEQVLELLAVPAGAR